MRFTLISGLGLLVVFSFSLWKRTPARSPLAEPLPQDSLIQVYFNQSEASRYTDPYRQTERLGDDLEQQIIDTILSAQSTLDVAVHELSLPGIAHALRDRQQAGVRVRVIMENDYNRSFSTFSPSDLARLEERDRQKYQEWQQLADQNRDGQVSPTEAADSDVVAILQSAQIPLIDDQADGSKGSALMHHKFVVVDGQIVLTGSVNFSMSDVHGDFLAPDSTGNANHLVKITHPDVARLYSQEFALMWGDGPGGQADSLFGRQKPYRGPQRVTLAPGSSLTIQFSPTSTSYAWNQSVNGLIGAVLNTAQHSIDAALFVFSDQALSNILEQRHQQGMDVRVLIDPGFAYRDYSEGLDLLGIALPNANCRLEVGNRPWANPIATVGIPTLAEGDLLHHKFGLVDQRIVISGSQNWSDAANTNNDENLLVIENPTVAAHFHREFERLYGTASLGIPPWLQSRVQEQRSRCQL